MQQRKRTQDVLVEDDIHFDQLLLPDDLLKGLAEAGYSKPSPIQLKAIPIGRRGIGTRYQN